MRKHLAIFRRPYLNLILDKQKTIESRFSKNKIAPYNKVQQGDVVLLKESGGLILGEFTVESVDYFVNKDIGNESNSWSDVRKYGKEICSYVDDGFWTSRADKKFATLIKIGSVYIYDKPKVEIYKKRGDRRSWLLI